MRPKHISIPNQRTTSRVYPMPKSALRPKLPRKVRWWMLAVVLLPLPGFMILGLPKKPVAPAAAARGAPEIAPSATLQNGDFEAASSAPWHPMLNNSQWGSFDIGTEQVTPQTTNHYARVKAQVPPDSPAIRVFGAVQEVIVNQGLPETLDFHFRVEQENPLCSKQYAQVVAIFLPEITAANAGNVQLRHVLHGVKVAPYEMTNARFVMNPPSTPLASDWRAYSLLIRQAFHDAYPGTDFSKGTLRLLFEARYDDMPDSVPPGSVALEVHYDNIDLQ